MKDFEYWEEVRDEGTQNVFLMHKRVTRKLEGTGDREQLCGFGTFNELDKQWYCTVCKKAAPKEIQDFALLIDPRSVPTITNRPGKVIEYDPTSKWYQRKKK